ncbi:unnamed protein product, partial [Rotaria sordida]
SNESLMDQLSQSYEYSISCSGVENPK